MTEFYKILSDYKPLSKIPLGRKNFYFVSDFAEAWHGHILLTLDHTHQKPKLIAPKDLPI